MRRILIAFALALLACAPASAQQFVGPCLLMSGNVADDDPNGDVLGSVCDEYWETDTGVAWRKKSGTNTNTGWDEIRTGSGAGTGTVTSVGLSAPSLFSVSGSPVVTAGTLDFSFTSQAANRVLASPDGSAGAPTMRALVADDLPSITTTEIANGTILLQDLDDSQCVDGEAAIKVGGVWTCATPSGGGGGAPAAAQYLTLATDATLTNERVLTPGNGIAGTDAGAGGAYTIALGNLSANFSGSHGSNTFTHTFGSTTSTANLFTLTDTASNTGTGYLFTAGTAATSTLKPFRVQWRAADRVAVDENGRVKLGTRSDVEFDAGNSGTALTVDWDDGNQQIVTLTGNVTFTFSDGQYGGPYRLLLVQDVTGGRTVTWPASVKWESDTAPTLNTTASKVTFCQFIHTSIGADGYFGFCTTSVFSQP